MTRDDKLPWDADCDGSGAALQRFMRALVCTGSHFTDSHTIGGHALARGVSVFFRVWIAKGAEQRFLDLAEIAELKPPPRVQIGMATPVDDGRRSLRRNTVTL